MMPEPTDLTADVIDVAELQQNDRAASTAPGPAGGPKGQTIEKLRDKFVLTRPPERMHSYPAPRNGMTIDASHSTTARGITPAGIVCGLISERLSASERVF